MDETRIKSLGSPYGTTSKGIVLNRKNRRRIAAMGGTRLERRMLREDSAVAKLELHWRLRRLEALREKLKRRLACSYETFSQAEGREARSAQ